MIAPLSIRWRWHPGEAVVDVGDLDGANRDRSVGSGVSVSDRQSGHVRAVTTSAPASSLIVINHRKEMKKLRLSDFTNPLDYLSTDTDAARGSGAN
jgi:hypothetical protein